MNPIFFLRHSDKREFLCNECGKTFKRKDKLKEHAKRIHENPLRKNNVAQNHPSHPGNHNQEVVYPDDVLAVSNAGPPGGSGGSSRLVIEDQKVILEDNNPEHNNNGSGDKFTPRVSLFLQNIAKYSKILKILQNTAK